MTALINGIHRRPLAALAALASAVTVPVAAPLAHADTDSYIADLRAHNIPVLPGFEGQWIQFGNQTCTQLRQGIPQDQVLAGSPGTLKIAVNAAQHELCPDTLH
jgi:Protein of unknown function (DUF732)